MIKSTAVAIQAPVRPEYPKVMKLKYGDRIVFFTAPRKGTVLQGDCVGFHTEDWCEEMFEPWTGKITIEVT